MVDALPCDINLDTTQKVIHEILISEILFLFFDDVLSTSRIKADIVYTLFCYLISYFANDAPFNKYKKGGNSVHPILLFDKIAVGRNRKNSVYDKH